MGGTHSRPLNLLAKQIWGWAIDKGIWLSAAHIPGKENMLADYKSRNFQDNLEWTLNPLDFRQITDTFGVPEVDLFATRLNNQVEKYVAWHPEPEAWAVDAFSVPWDDLQFYAFPPFSLIGRVLSKVVQEEAQGILVVPLWTTQPWFPHLLKLLIDHPRVVQPCRNLLTLPGKAEEVHPLFNKLQLLVVHLSGVHWKNCSYLQQLPSSLPTPGETEPSLNTTQHYVAGENFVFKEKLIPLLPL